jgi:hypothetical protein
VSELNNMGCAGFAEVAAELALGVLTGRERAEALAHLDRCAACQGDVRRLTATGEELLRLLPAAEPPPGFATRALERPGRGRRVLAVAAVTLAVAVAALGGWGLGTAGSSPARSSRSSAVLLSAGGRTVGTIFFYSGSQQWLSMSVDIRSETGTVLCQLVSRGGNVVTLGSFWLDAGYGTWGSLSPVSHGQFTGARLVSADGAILATARFPLS